MCTSIKHKQLQTSKLSNAYFENLQQIKCKKDENTKIAKPTRYIKSNLIADSLSFNSDLCSKIHI